MKWIACHDTIVCIGSKAHQKWCVRENDEKGKLVAVMLTKQVAHFLAGSPEAYEALLMAKDLIDKALPKFDWGKSALSAEAITLLNEFPGKVNAALKKIQHN